jgi:hypothetical protein
MPPEDRADSIEKREAKESTEVAEAAEPIEKSDAAEPIDPTDRTEPTDAMESTDPSEARESSEFRDRSDHREPCPDPAGSAVDSSISAQLLARTHSITGANVSIYGSWTVM